MHPVSSSTPAPLGRLVRRLEAHGAHAPVRVAAERPWTLRGRRSRGAQTPLQLEASRRTYAAETSAVPPSAVSAAVVGAETGSEVAAATLSLIVALGGSW